MRNKAPIHALALWVTIASFSHASAQPATGNWKLVDALPAYRPSICVAPNPQERSRFELAASAIELVGHETTNWLDIGAQKYLAGNHVRRDGATHVFVCVPQDIVSRVSAALASRKAFAKGRLVEYQLQLASRLPSPSPDIVDAIGRSAFAPSPQQSEIFNDHDIRPYARTVLASFGADSKRFSKLAYDQISSKTSMGTGAAQVAAERWPHPFRQRPGVG